PLRSSSLGSLSAALSLGNLLPPTWNSSQPVSIAPSTSADQIEYHSPLRELVNLRELDLSGNRVRLMCDDWRSAWSLRRLDLAHNLLTALTDTDLAFTSQSIKVDLRHNRITRFRPYVYPAGTAATPTVFLDHNPFSCDCRLYPAVDLLRRRALTAAL
ncbi:jg26276, partial [Pararge aegeria aegeria]